MPLKRAGTTLAELLVALVLGGIVIALCASSVVAQRRSERNIAAAYRPAVAAEEAANVLASSLARVSGADDVVVRGDTALDLHATIGVALACFAAADSIVVADNGAGTWWERAPDSADAIHMGAADGSWSQTEIIAVRTRSSGGACGAPHRTLWVQPSVAIVGTPLVRVARRTRFMLYRGSDGAWWLGERTCANGIIPQCGSAQPIAGPLAASPAGLRFAVDSVSGVRRISLTVTAGTATRSRVVPLHP